jgi:hypothetical protein
MKTMQTIVIEVHKGCVTGVYATGQTKTWPRVLVVDLDGAELGDSTEAEEQCLESLEIASDIVREAVEEKSK